MSFSIEQDLIDSLIDDPNDWEDYRKEDNMFSDVRIWPMKNQNSKLKANGSVLINNAIRVKFIIAQGSKGLFVGLPSRSYKDKEGNTKWSNEVYIENNEIMNNLNTQVIAAYNEILGNTFHQGDAAGPDNQDEDVPW